MDWKGSPQFHPRRWNLFNETVGSRLCMNYDPKGGGDKSPHGCRELWALRTCESVLWALTSLDKSFPVLDSSGSKLWQSFASTSKATLSHIPPSDPVCSQPCSSFLSLGGIQCHLPILMTTCDRDRRLPHLTCHVLVVTVLLIFLIGTP